MRELLNAGSAHVGPERARSGRSAFDIRAAPTLHGVAQDLERQLYERLYAELGGDFEAMATRLLDKPGPGGARKVRLRFNQLGLRVRGRGRVHDS